MTSWKKWLLMVVVVAVVAEQAWLVAPTVLRLVFPPQTDAAERGRIVAEGLGCFSCHGPEGAGGIANPGSKDGVVPALGGGEIMMWADSEEEVREWILYGHPLEDEEETHGDDDDGHSHDGDDGDDHDEALEMPAFEPFLGAGELDLLIAYIGSISGLQFPDDHETAEGLEHLYELGCFRCHGPMGTGGVANPGSLKGYVPGFFGEDFAELVRDREEARQWVAEGISERFAENPLAQTVMERQAINMPAYGRFMDADEIEELVDATMWLAGGKWREMPVP
jgi:cytochrome c553